MRDLYNRMTKFFSKYFGNSYSETESWPMQELDAEELRASFNDPSKHEMYKNLWESSREESEERARRILEAERITADDLSVLINTRP